MARLNFNLTVDGFNNKSFYGCVEEHIPKIDTTRSWRAMRLIFCWIVSIGAGLGAALAWFSDMEMDWPQVERICVALGLGLLSGIGGWLAAWLFIAAVAFIWWFILDRIREFVRAAKGQP